MDNSLDFYTYTHSAPQGGIFYVGKGSGRRVYSMADRSYLWREELNKHDGILMQVVNRFATEEEAFIDEQRLVCKCLEKGLYLVNQTEGGKGATGYKQSKETRKKIADAIRGFKHEIVSCPKCGDTGGLTSMKRWHFDNCKGATNKFKARVTVNNNRLFLGVYPTKEKADEAMHAYYKSVGKEIPKEFYRKGTGRVKPVAEVV